MSDDSVYAPFSIARHEDGTRIELGRGAMGITYRATDTQLGRTVALKVINATYLDNANARQRFFAEARAAAQLHHSNVAGVFQLRAEGEDIFYAMKWRRLDTFRRPAAHPSTWGWEKRTRPWTGWKRRSRTRIRFYGGTRAISFTTACTMSLASSRSPRKRSFGPE